MTVLVTGGAGFLGRHICRQLFHQGRTPRAFDLRKGAEAPWERIEGSILDAHALRQALAGCEGVIHCAAISDLWQHSPRTYEQVNVAGTAAVLSGARRVGATFVHVSSYTVLIAGPRYPSRCVDETITYEPGALLGPYPRSKRASELLVEAVARDGQPACIVLPASPVGPGDTQLTPPSRMILDLARGALPAYLDCPMNLVDVTRVADGAIKALDRGKAGRRYLLSGEDLRLGEIAAMIGELTGVPAPKHTVPYGLALAAGYGEAAFSRLTGKRPKAPLTGVRLAGREVRFCHARARDELDFTPGQTKEALTNALLWMADQEFIDALPLTPSGPAPS